MKILIAPDKFKGSLSASKVAEELARGIRKKHPTAQIEIQPMADGGDGSIDLLNEVWELTEYQVEVSDPLFRKIRASYFANDDHAFIEMAKASGIALLKKEEQNPMKTTSLGTGELIHHAYSKGFKNITLFIGGSATNDGGIGIASALGYRFFDESHIELRPIGANLSKIHSIEFDALATSISNLNLRVICDVENPFFGKNGAAHVYARQKGANELMIEKLDVGLQNLSNRFHEILKVDIRQLKGAGAAGGVGGGMVAQFNAQMISGIQFFIDLFDLESKIQEADFVISGEGQLDDQSLQGKVIGGVLQLCKKYQKPLFVACGRNALESQSAYFQGVNAIMNLTTSVEKAMSEPAKFLEMMGEGFVFQK